MDKLRNEGEALVRTIDNQKAEIDRLEDEIQHQKKTEIAHIKMQWQSLQKDLGDLEKDLIEK